MAGIFILYNHNQPPQSTVAKATQAEKKPVAPPLPTPATQPLKISKSYPNTQPAKTQPRPSKPLLPDSTATTATATTPSPRRKSPFSSSVVPRSTGRVRQPHADPAPEISKNTIRAPIPIKRFPTAPLLTPPLQVGDSVYFASKDGQFYTIDAASLKLLEQRKLGWTVKRLFTEGAQLKAKVNGPDQKVLEFNQPIEAPDPEDIEANDKVTMVNGQVLPKAWYERQLFFNQVVFYQGKYYQPAPVSVKVFEDGEVRDYISSVPGLEHWKIALLPSGPLGYDKTSVYELDEHLCPTRRIINLEYFTFGEARANDVFLAGDGKTLCFVQQTDGHRRMMIWSLDGQKKIREVPVLLARNVADDEAALNLGNYRPPGGRLRAVAGGYLFCGIELTWVPAGEGDVIQLKPNEEVRSMVIDGKRKQSTSQQRYGILNVTPPAIAGDKIIVGFGGGDIFVFDAAGFSKGEAGPRSADADK